MKKTRTLKSKKREKELAALAAVPDESIDFSDIPELTEEDFGQARRGRFYRPVKRPVTIRLDSDVVEWLKQDGPGYQTKANRLLRVEMLRSFVSSNSSKNRHELQLSSNASEDRGAEVWTSPQQLADAKVHEPNARISSRRVSNTPGTSRTPQVNTPGLGVSA